MTLILEDNPNIRESSTYPSHLGFEFGYYGFHDMTGSGPTGEDITDQKASLNLHTVRHAQLQLAE